jgi:hypothetical protein
MRKQLRLGSSLSWIVVWVLALAAPTIYLLWPSDVTWYSSVLVFPLLLLVGWSADNKTNDPPAGGGGGGDGGAGGLFGPPV